MPAQDIAHSRLTFCLRSNMGLPGAHAPQRKTPSKRRRSEYTREARFSLSAGGAAAQVALDVLELGVAHVLAVHHVDHVLADVLGMVADALQRAHDPHDVESTADAARILHHERDALTLDGLVFL